MAFLQFVEVEVRMFLLGGIVNVVVVVLLLHLNVVEDIHVLDQGLVTDMPVAVVARLVLEMGDDVPSLRLVLAVLVRPALFLALQLLKEIGTVNEVVQELQLVDAQTIPVNAIVEIIIAADHHQEGVLVHLLQIVGEGVRLLPLHQNHRRKGRITLKKLKMGVTRTVEVLLWFYLMKLLLEVKRM